MLFLRGKILGEEQQLAVGSGGEVASAVPTVSDHGDWGGVQGWGSKGYLSTRGSYWILMQNGAQAPKRMDLSPVPAGSGIGSNVSGK